MNPKTEWQPVFSRWRHGGWYVSNMRYLGGGCGCVSNNYPDRKWRIVCDPRRSNLGVDGDVTFSSRQEAAVAEYEMAKAQIEQELRNWGAKSDVGGYCQSVGDLEVHLTADSKLGYGVSVVRTGKIVTQPRYSGCFEQTLEWARDAVCDLQRPRQK